MQTFSLFINMDAFGVNSILSLFSGAFILQRCFTVQCAAVTGNDLTFKVSHDESEKLLLIYLVYGSSMSTRYSLTMYPIILDTANRYTGGTLFFTICEQSTNSPDSLVLMDNALKCSYNSAGKVFTLTCTTKGPLIAYCYAFSCQ